ncbi:DUF6194 family protein [Streptomyces spiramenti]|uniref:SMI1/KNR4 family protein n=1 Tax=Streptomyces spiramenti TaxID=2720606 RepID=A0ABX1ADU3_9ACTN|nr:DUF6194 family protein [Streptomyces spiramenti]NJP65333.1 SMI1/KNR4 family protein [Streptomyces spiramenti]
MARFEEISATFWDAPDTCVDPDADALPEADAGDDAHHPPLTDDAVAEAEHTLGVALPPELLTLLRLRNGGTVPTRRDAFPTDVPNAWADHVPFDELLGIGNSEDGPAADRDHAATDVLQPHPVYRSHGWVAIVNPTERSLPELLRLLRSAHEDARRRAERRDTTG